MFEVIRELDKNKKPEASVVTIGAFDGIHIGHEKIIRKALEEAKHLRCKSCVVTFDPHPSAIVSNAPAPVLLSLPRKIQLIKELGTDMCLLINFNRKFSQLPARSFVKKVLVEYLSAKIVIIGYNYVFGKDCKGNADTLSEMGTEYKFGVRQILPVKIGKDTVSSTKIRAFVREANFLQANAFLGRPYEITGKVGKGKGKGRIVGFPTANLNEFNNLLPPPGVYAGFAVFQKHCHKAVLNLGWQPTFSRKTQLKGPTAEVHILDFDKNIYGSELTFCFLDKIREEVSFGNTEKLKKQIEKDVDITRKLVYN